jgi:hypothetical protein
MGVAASAANNGNAARIFMGTLECGDAAAATGHRGWIAPISRSWSQPGRNPFNA